MVRSPSTGARGRGKTSRFSQECWVIGPVGWSYPGGMNRTIVALWGASVISMVGCTAVPGASQPSGDRADLAHGVDISWMSQLESLGVSWMEDGVVTALPSLLKTKGLDAIRLRVMVDPASTNYLSPDGTSLLGFVDQAGVVAMAKRCWDAGFRRFLIDFHFSDTWADPAHQHVPAAWEGHDLATLAEDIEAHVTSVLNALGDVGITPEWVQVGNEQTNGILFGSVAGGKVSGTVGWTSLVTLINAGYRAVKAVDPSIQVVIHLDRGGQNALYRWWFDQFAAAGGQWDVIGVSFYPFWQPEDTVSMLRSNLEDLISRYDKSVMVVEIGGLYNQAPETKVLLEDVKAAVAGLPGGRGLGLFYWEPESSPSVVKGYQLGASTVVAGKTLRLTEALDGLGYQP